MEKAIVDTNVILRYLTNDVPEQARKVTRRFVEAQHGKLQLLLLHITVVEIVFHMTHWYKFSREDSAERVKLLLAFPWLEVEYKDDVLQALSFYAKTSFDFVDILSWSLAHANKASLLSFDKDFDKLEPAIRLSP